MKDIPSVYAVSDSSLAATGIPLLQPETTQTVPTYRRTHTLLSLWMVLAWLKEMITKAEGLGQLVPALELSAVVTLVMLEAVLVNHNRYNGFILNPTPNAETPAQDFLPHIWGNAGFNPPQVPTLSAPRTIDEEFERFLCNQADTAMAVLTTAGIPTDSANGVRKTSSTAYISYVNLAARTQRSDIPRARDSGLIVP
ncbi:hypothetical protein K440DRAFT_667143 [Wilcoxina mikolae CBS 423.85]|nr:hypothetical protein K440DRAFT_667143 [Wilcoxina mikolae CBS 423.85]